MDLLDKKVLRDINTMRGAATAIVLIIACGVATFIMSASTLDSLTETRDAFYNEFRFAHVFARLKRAPETLKPRIEEIPGVARVETRVVAAIKIDIEGDSGASFAVGGGDVVHWGKAGEVTSAIVMSIFISGAAGFVIQRAIRGAIRDRGQQLTTLLLHGGWIAGASGLPHCQ